MSEELGEKDKVVPGRGSRNFKYFDWLEWVEERMPKDKDEEVIRLYNMKGFIRQLKPRARF